MGSPSLVSVITIFYNEERFLQEAIDSVLAQAYANWELLLVDDGSSDSGTAIAKTAVRNHPGRVHYCHHPGHANMGMSASRNLGISHARGAYITFVDADDVLDPQKLEQQVEVLVSRPETALVVGPALWWYGWTGRSKDLSADFVQRFDLPLDSVVQPPNILNLFLQDEWASLCDLMIRREVVQAVGGYENSFTGMFEDQVFHTKLCLKYEAYICSRNWYRYRQHSRSHVHMAEEKGQHRMSRQRFLQWLETYLISQKITDDKVWRILEKEKWRLHHPVLRSIICNLKYLAWLPKRCIKKLLGLSKTVINQT